MEMAWVSIAVTIIIFFITHLGVTIWWAAKVNTILGVVKDDLEKITKKLESLPSREEVTKDIKNCGNDRTEIKRRLENLEKTVLRQ
jgi:uncharacterized protein (DUF3084 family)